MPTKSKAGQNCWAVICPEPNAPGVWETWVKEHCVAIGWNPQKYHLLGKTKNKSWKQARQRIQNVREGDTIIPFLKEHTFGIPGIVKRVAATDDEWNPTVMDGRYSRDPGEDALGRRIEVEWLTKNVPPLDKIAVMPKTMQKTYGEVRSTIERVRPPRYARFMNIINDRRNWVEYRKSPTLTTVTPEKGNVAKPQIASFLAEDRKFLERARRAFPILVRLAQARQKIFYSNLADELEMRNPRNLNYVLGAVGQAIQELAAKWKQEIPPLQCLVVQKSTGLPGNGIAWFIRDLKEFSKRTPDERRQILNVELVKVFNYPSWDRVLDEFGLMPLPTDPVIAALKAKACRMGGVGEQEDHKNLKHYIANNPDVLGFSNFKKGNTEYCFPSADRMDVVFSDENDNHWIGVEVKGPSSGEADIVRGMFQCVKYTALREAELKYESRGGSTRVVLALSGKLPSHLIQIKNLLGVEVVEEVTVPESFRLA